MVKEQNWPDKHIYYITNEGKNELPKMIYKLFEKHDDISELILGIINLKYVDRDKVIDILKKKIGHRDKKWEQLASFKNRVEVKDGAEELISFLSEIVKKKFTQTAESLEQFLQLIENEKI